MVTGFSDSRWRYVSIVVFSLLLFGKGSRGLSQAPGGREPNLTPAQRKIAPVIRTTVAQMIAAGIKSSNAASLNAAQRYSSPLLRVDNKFRMQLYLDLTDLNAGRLATLAATSEIEIEIVNESLKRIQAWVPCEKIEALAALDFVARIRPPEYAILRTGGKNSEGDSILKADRVRSTLGLTGAGVKVGVISDGANNAADAQASGDLPASITIFGSCNPTVTRSTCNEGTAMLEIIHDLAPGATLAMGDEHTSLEFIQRVTDLRTWGAKVIVDDAGFFDQPYFEDGTVAAAYSAALAQGIVMVSAAGNDAQTHYQAQFVANDSSSHPPHNFGGGKITMHFTSPPGSLAIFLQWSDQFGHSGDDYDLCLTDAAGNDFNPPICSADFQDGTQDPIENLQLVCTSIFGCGGDIRITKFSGAVQTLEVFFLGADPTEFVVPGDSIFGHPAVPGVISVGAIRASDPGNLAIEPFSSRGPSTVFFPSFQQRTTPTLTTVDCVSVTGAGGFDSTFCGTSAAAPHAAGVAALLLQANPTLSPAQVLSAMQVTAADRGASGFDNTFGAGLVNALAAVTSVNQLKKRPGQITSAYLRTTQDSEYSSFWRCVAFFLGPSLGRSLAHEPA